MVEDPNMYIQSISEYICTIFESYSLHNKIWCKYGANMVQIWCKYDPDMLDMNLSRLLRVASRICSKYSQIYSKYAYLPNMVQIWSNMVKYDFEGKPHPF